IRYPASANFCSMAEALVTPGSKLTTTFLVTALASTLLTPARLPTVLRTVSTQCPQLIPGTFSETFSMTNTSVVLRHGRPSVEARPYYLGR
ncbi:MAG: hypothetical protein Q7O66_20525, partial [Dehalococcoidia bacterium]|nr:hypothetical protein [Dehalococcoidia bacterium]